MLKFFLKPYLGCQIKIFYPWTILQQQNNIAFIFLAWSYKGGGRLAIEAATKNQCNFCFLEDGFIAYIGHPATKSICFSVVVDNGGIYYDASRPNMLEDKIRNISWFDQYWHDRATKLISDIIHYQITKYNFYQKSAESNYLDVKNYILLIDQVRGDKSIEYGLADEQSFEAMLTSARRENPDCQIVIRVHPDIELKKKRGYLSEIASNEEIIIAKKINPFLLLKKAKKVYTVTSQMGFEALLAGKQVVCFGAPFYAGWGLTDDRIIVPRRGMKRSIQQLFAASYISYCQYVHPITNLKCQLEDIIEYIISASG